MHVLLCACSDRKLSTRGLSLTTSLLRVRSLVYSRPSRRSRYLAHKLPLLIHQAYALDNPTLRYIEPMQGLELFVMRRTSSPCICYSQYCKSTHTIHITKCKGQNFSCQEFFERIFTSSVLEICLYHKLC